MKYRASALLETLFATVIMLATIALVISCVFNTLKTFGHLQVLKAEIYLDTFVQGKEEDEVKVSEFASSNGISIEKELIPYGSSNELSEIHLKAVGKDGKVYARYRKIIFNSTKE